MQNNIAQEKISSLGSLFHNSWSNCMISMKIPIENFTTVDHKITKLAWHELSFPQVCTQHDNVKIKCTTKRFNKKALIISCTEVALKKIRNWQLYQLNEFRTLYTSGGYFVYLACTNWKWLAYDTCKSFWRKALCTPRLSKYMST